MTQTKDVAVLKDAKQGFSFTPATLDEAKQYAAILANSGMIPTQFAGKPDAVLVAVQFGREIGLAPLQALQSIYIVNNRPTVWGDSVVALAQTSPAYEYHHEFLEGTGEARVAVCQVKRKGSPVHTVRFGYADAKRAGLLNKETYQKYPDRMYTRRARAAFIDQFAAEFRGLALAEEQQDYASTRATPVEMPRAIGEKPPTLIEAIKTVEAELAPESPAIPEQPELTGNSGETALPEFITEAQRRRLFALMKEAGKTKEQVKDFLALNGIESSTTIPVGFYPAVEAFIVHK